MEDAEKSNFLQLSVVSAAAPAGEIIGTSHVTTNL
jgi:hypothetical protein